MIKFKRREQNMTSFKYFFPIYCSYFCVRRTDGVARIFIFFPLFIFPGMCHLMVKDYSRHVREREERRKKEEEKSPEKTTSPRLGFEPTDFFQILIGGPEAE